MGLILPNKSNTWKKKQIFSVAAIFQQGIADTDDVPSLDPNVRRLYGTAAGVGGAPMPSVDYDQRRLVSTTVRFGSNVPSVDWEQRQLIEAGGAITLNWDVSQLIDADFKQSVDWSGRVLMDGVEGNSVDWGNRTLKKIDGSTALDWSFGVGSKRFVFASELGIILDGDLNNPAVGTDQTATVENAINFYYLTYGPFTLIIDGVLYAHDIKMRTGMTIRGLGWSTGIVQSPGGTCAIRNLNWRSPYTLGAHNGQIMQTDLVIENLMINGNQLNASANPLRTGHWTDNGPAAPNWRKSTAAGILCSPVQIYGCDRLRISNLYILDPCFVCIHLGYVKNFRIEGCYLRDSIHQADPTAGANTGGVQVQGGSSDGVIDGCWGYTADDFIALNTEDWNLNNPGDPSLLKDPVIFGGGWDSVWHGPITNITIQNTNLVYCQNGIRLMSLSDLLDKITVRGLKGKVSYYALQTTPDQFTNYPFGGGNIGRVVVEDIDVQTTTHTAGVSRIHLDARIKSLVLRDTRRGTLTDAWDAIFVEALADIDYLVIDGMTISESGAVAGVGIYLYRHGAGHVRTLKLSNISWRRVGQALLDGALVESSGGIIDSIQLDHVDVDLVTNVILLGAGSNVAAVQMTNVRHTNAGGNPTIAIHSSITLPKLRTAGLSCALLSSGGAITNKRTDHTEDDASGIAAVGGATTQVQYNNTGVFAGSANFIWDQAHTTATVNGELIVGSSTDGFNGVGCLEVIGPTASFNIYDRAVTAISDQTTAGNRFAQYVSGGIWRLWTGTLGDIFKAASTGDVTFNYPVVATERLVAGQVTLVPSSNAVTPDVSLANDFVVTNAANLTINNPTSNPGLRQKITISVKNSGGSAITVTLGNNYRLGTDLTVVTDVAAGKTNYLTFVRNTTDGKWDFVAEVRGF